MKKISILVIALVTLCTTHSLFAQKIISQDRASAKYGIRSYPTIDQKFHQAERLVESQSTLPVLSNSAGKTTGSLQNPVTLGRASNAFTILRSEQNQVFANDSLGMVAFIHRQDVTIWGGGATANGKLRYDISTNRGANWMTDVGILNSAYSFRSRYPQLSATNMSGTLNPLDAKMVYHAPLLDGSNQAWDGIVAGLSDVKAQPSSGTEHYLNQGHPGYLPGGLCQSIPGTFYTVSKATDGQIAVSTYDSTLVYKGVYNTGTKDIDWDIQASIVSSHNKTFDGNVRQTGTNISFSPDGQTGWVAFLGDLTGGIDSVYAPVFSKSTDAGNSWGAPIEVDLRNVQHLMDSINFYLTIDTITGDTIPAGSGVPTTAFDADITVDANGNPHLLAIIGNGTEYSLQSGLWKGTYDITSTDGGTTWDARFISSVLGFRGEFGCPDNDGNLISMDNYPQISRNEAGTHIFYSWVDSDTAVTSSFGDNFAPNLRISAYRISDGYRTCNHSVTNGDILWDGKILWPTLSPTVLSDEGSGCYNMPVVFANMLSNCQLDPTQFIYLGNDANFNEIDFVDPATVSLGYDNACTPLSGCTITESNPTLPPQAGTSFLAYPNPTSGSFTIRIGLEKSANVEIEMLNLLGQQVKHIQTGRFESGVTELDVVTEDLPNGIYILRMQSNEQVLIQKLQLSR